MSKPTPIERFTAKVKRTPGCWLWQGSLTPLGYGQFSYLGDQRAHRASWRIFCGEIPSGMFVLHRCDVRNCVNPEHLFLGTQADNIRDKVAKGRCWKPREQCKRGHLFKPGSYYSSKKPNGIISRTCKECSRLGHVRRRAKFQDHFTPKNKNSKPKTKT